MNLRDDALVKAARLITALNKAFLTAAPGLVGPIGELKVHPGAFNIIPGKVEMSLDLRSMKKTSLQAVRKQIREIVLPIGNVQIEILLSKGGVTMNREIMKAIEISRRERRIR